MSEERVEIPDGVDSKFVRAGDRYVFGDPEGFHVKLADRLGLTTREQGRQPDVDMGIVVRSGTLVTVRGRSIGFNWPPRDKPEIREETVRQLRDLVPDFTIRS